MDNNELNHSTVTLAAPAEKLETFAKRHFESDVAKPSVTVSRQEIDAFRMKAITLLKHHEVKFSSLSEKLSLIKEEPIIATETRNQHSPTSESIIAVHQTITSFPGETIELKGLFRRYRTKNLSCPIPDSFHINTEVKQTGYPHASQHNGWIVPMYFIKDEEDLKQMRHVAENLLPQGIWNEKAKQNLKLKQDLFNKHINDYLKVLESIHLSLLAYAKMNGIEIIHNFYEIIRHENKVYSYLSSIHQCIAMNMNESFDNPEINAYVKLIKDIYKTVENSSLMENLAKKQLSEFIKELEEKDFQVSFRWIQETLKTDLQCIKGL